MDFCLEIKYVVTDNHDDNKITVGPDPDGLNLIAVQFDGDKERIITPEQAELLAEALTKAVKDARSA